MVFYDSRFQDFPHTEKSTESHILFYEGGPSDHCKNVPVTVAQSSAEIDYNAACTAGMALAHFRILNNGLLNKNIDVIP